MLFFLWLRMLRAQFLLELTNFAYTHQGVYHSQRMRVRVRSVTCINLASQPIHSLGVSSVETLVRQRRLTPVPTGLRPVPGALGFAPPGREARAAVGGPRSQRPGVARLDIRVLAFTCSRQS